MMQPVFPELPVASGGPLSVSALRVPADASPSSPFSLLVDFDGADAEKGVRIELGRGAKAAVELRYSAPPDAAGSFRTALDVSLGAGASLDLSIVSSLPIGVKRDAAASVFLESRASLRWTESVFDEGEGRYRCVADLSGERCEFDFAGAYGAAGRTRREHVLDELHQGKGAKSRAVLKSVLLGSSRLSFKGLIHVAPGAPGTDAYLSNRNLLLEDGARADSLPQLRIETDDVACSHGSTTGGPREEELFYLMSRGLDFGTARGLLALGHLSAVFDRLPAAAAEESEAFAGRVLAGVAGRGAP